MTYYKKNSARGKWEKVDGVCIKDDILVLTGLEVPALPEIPFTVTLEIGSLFYKAKAE